MNSASPKTKQVWILDEGSQGHIVQSRGMIRELAKAVPLSVSEIAISCVLPRRISRSLVKRLLDAVRRKWMFRLLHPRMKLPENAPDLIVSSGPHSLAVLEFLSKHHKCPSVFIQGTIAVPQGAVTCVMRPFEGVRRDDFIFIPLLFTEITPELVKAAGKQYLREKALHPSSPINALFIGNSSSKIRFSTQDWDAIICFVNNLWKSTGSQWLITTSYRTGRDLEDRFRMGIEPGAILSAVWYSRTPDKVTKPYLGLADRVFVTMDSLTMLTEAIASGLPTCTLCPSDMHGEPTNTHLRYVHYLTENGFITRTDARLTSTPVMRSGTRDIDYSGSIHRLLSLIHWNP
jgi:uncharacterized protein